MWRYTYNLRGIYETPELADDADVDRERAEEIIAGVRDAGRTILTEYESKRLLAAYGIPTVETEVARSADEAVELAEGFGYPVVLKLNSQTITHKTDVGGVRLNLQDAEEVRGPTRRWSAPSPRVLARGLRRGHRAADGQAWTGTSSSSAAASTRSSGPCCSSARAASSSRSTRTGPSPCRR